MDHGPWHGAPRTAHSAQRIHGEASVWHHALRRRGTVMLGVGFTAVRAPSVSRVLCAVRHTVAPLFVISITYAPCAVALCAVRRAMWPLRTAPCVVRHVHPRAVDRHPVPGTQRAPRTRRHQRDPPPRPHHHAARIWWKPLHAYLIRTDHGVGAQERSCVWRAPCARAPTPGAHAGRHGLGAHCWAPCARPVLCWARVCRAAVRRAAVRAV